MTCPLKAEMSWKVKGYESFLYENEKAFGEAQTKGKRKQLFWANICLQYLNSYEKKSVFK